MGVCDGAVFGRAVSATEDEAKRCAETVKILFLEGKAKWLKEQCSGKVLYEFLEKRTNDLGYRLVKDVDGHRVSEFPHQKHTKVALPTVEFYPTAYLWILELQIVHPTLPIGAFYEDLMF